MINANKFSTTKMKGRIRTTLTSKEHEVYELFAFDDRQKQSTIRKCVLNYEDRFFCRCIIRFIFYICEA